MIKPVIYSEEIKRRLCDRKSVYSEEVENTVKAILAEVKANGDKALKFYTEKFDGVVPESFAVTDEEIANAINEIDKNYIKVLKTSAANIAEFHKNQLKTGFKIERENYIIGQKVTPVKCAGIYVPGGTAAYPSTVLMNAIPAKIAGVEQIIMVSPPQKDGKIKKEVLAAAKIAGVDKVFKIGGAQAIAALAYGTESVPKADVIAGPGNIYVAMAKKLIYGTVGIDMVAGPSEILIIADNSATPEHVAADMLSQAEHDKMASAILLTDSESLAEQTSKALERRVKELPRREIAEKSLQDNCKIIICESIDKALNLSNEYAPEHLELALDKPFDYLDKVKNAGSVFLGHNTPEAVGDYYAGSNHTLPTGGTAAFSSPLGVDDFVKTTQYVYYTESKLQDAANDIITFANSEGLTAHAESVAVRMKK